MDLSKYVCACRYNFVYGCVGDILVRCMCINVMKRQMGR